MTLRSTPNRKLAIIKTLCLSVAAITLVASLTSCKPPPGSDPVGRTHHAINGNVPYKLRKTINYRVFVIGGYTSKAWTNGDLEISRWQMNQSWHNAAFLALHEYGHLIAYKHGTKAYLGAPPQGFPTQNAEVWADCFAYALTGVRYRNLNCSESNRRWAANWINTWR
jgi:hypothetical protein